MAECYTIKHYGNDNFYRSRIQFQCYYEEQGLRTNPADMAICV
jgi:hypothetical protein